MLASFSQNGFKQISPSIYPTAIHRLCYETAHHFVKNANCALLQSFCQSIGSNNASPKSVPLICPKKHQHSRL
jgi:hypothetical protein